MRRGATHKTMLASIGQSDNILKLPVVGQFGLGQKREPAEGGPQTGSMGVVTWLSAPSLSPLAVGCVIRRGALRGTDVSINPSAEQYPQSPTAAQSHPRPPSTHAHCAPTIGAAATEGGQHDR